MVSTPERAATTVSVAHGTGGRSWASPRCELLAARPFVVVGAGRCSAAACRRRSWSTALLYFYAARRSVSGTPSCLVTRVPGVACQTPIPIVAANHGEPETGVKAVSACTLTRLLDQQGCPANTDGLDALRRRPIIARRRKWENLLHLPRSCRCAGRPAGTPYLLATHIF